MIVISVRTTAYDWFRASKDIQVSVSLCVLMGISVFQRILKAGDLRP